MRRLLTLSLIATAPLGLSVLAPLPAFAQTQDRFIIIYGSDRCPSSAGQEIVVCVRQPETERYRIPKDLRENEISPSNMSWAQRAKSVEYVGKSGAQSCSAEGSGGWTGCMKKIFAEARAQREADKKAAAGVP